MAKNFGKAGNLTFEKVGRKDAEKAQVAVIQNIAAADLIDNPSNGEDITCTEDLELSIRQNGFTDPLEVTDFNMEPGKYMILSGHRRRSAGVKTGMDIFPALVRHFKNKNEMINYMLLSNSQRDSARDPFLFSKRYKMHEQYLLDSGFKGNKREEIAKRLGLSVQQADRYNTMNKVILAVWDLVSAEKVGMSSVLPMAVHSKEEQEEIYKIMQDALSDEAVLTRNCVKQLIDGYRNGKKTWFEIKEPEEVQLSGNVIKNPEPAKPVKFISPSEPEEIPVKNLLDRNDEIRMEHEPSAEDAVMEDNEKSEWEREQKEEKLQFRPEVTYTVANESNNREMGLKTKKEGMADNIIRNLQFFDKNLAELYHCRDSKTALEMLNAMGRVAAVLIEEMFNISEEYKVKEDFKKNAGSIKKILDNYS